jgi:TRAP-type mannitol/chloroaromatic compound transport system permease small subunit
MERLRHLAGGIDAIVDAAGRMVAWVMLALVLLMSGNVLLRYLFSIGSVASQELEWHLMSPIVLIGMAYALLRDGHLRVDLIYAKLPERARLAVNLAAALIGIVFSGLVVYLAWKYVLQAYAIGEGSPDPGGLPHRFILKAFIPLGFALLLLHSIAEAIHAWRALVTGADRSRASQ